MTATDAPCLASAWAAALLTADAPRPWAPPREGGRVPGLRRLPPAARLGREALTAALTAGLERDAALATLAASARTSDPVALAALRAAALLMAVADGGGGGGSLPDPAPLIQAATLDARSAVARAPLGSLAAAVATYLRGAALEAVHDNSAALLDVATAIATLDTARERLPRLPHPPTLWTDAAARLARRVPGPHAAAFAASGPSALAATLAADADAATPPILRPKPKYYHYFKWMEARLAGVCGGVLPPPPVVDRLLASDAGALDDLLVHGAGALRAVQRLTAALEAGGPDAVEAAPIPRLAWAEMAAVQAARAAGGGAGSGGVLGLGGGDGPSVPDGLAWRLEAGPKLLPAAAPEAEALALKAFDGMD